MNPKLPNMHSVHYVSLVVTSPSLALAIIFAASVLGRHKSAAAKGMCFCQVYC